MAFRWRANDGPLLVLFRFSLHSYKEEKKKRKKKRCQSWTPSGKIFWIRAWKDIFKCSCCFDNRSQTIVICMVVVFVRNKKSILNLVMLNVFVYYTPPHVFLLTFSIPFVSMFFSIILEKSVDPDRMASSEASWSW